MKMRSTEQRFPLPNRAPVILAALSLLLPLRAWAGGTVTNCTEADFLAATVGGGRVTFACDGTITLSQTFTNNLDMVLDGTGHNVTFGGGGAVRVFVVSTNVTLSVVHLTVASGRACSGAGILSLGGNVILSSASFVGNTAVFVPPYMAVEGGAITMLGGSLRATNCTFSGNTADHLSAPIPFRGAKGGAIRNDGGSVILQNCAFLNNSAVGEAGIWTPLMPGEDAAGGALFTSGTLMADSCLFQANSASGGAGVDGSHGSVGAAGTRGGSGSGGAIHNLGAMTVNRSLFNQNSVNGGNGGSGATGGFDGASFWPGGDGGAGGDAAGAALFNGGTASLGNCTLARNSAHGGAGRWGGYGGTVGVVATAGGNGGRAGLASGGLFNAGTVGLLNCTIANNTATAQAGGDGSPGGSGHAGARGGNGGNGGSASGGIYGPVTLLNSILGSNSASAGLGGAGGPGGGGLPPGLPGNPGTNGQAGGNAYGYLTDAGHNLSSDASCAFTNVGSMNNTDPLLAQLADNGGPTLTMALPPGSPAIDAGDTAAAPPTDQRGYVRPAGAAADIGAFEFGAAPAVVLAIRQTAASTLEVQGQWAIGTNQTCRLLSSTDMLGWTPIATNQFSANGTVVFGVAYDPAAAPHFYRLSVP